MDVSRLHDTELLGGRDAVARKCTSEPISTHDLILEPGTASRIAGQAIDRLGLSLGVEAQCVHGFFET